MQEHEYRARDKTVKKMSRDGLKEENLHSRKSIRVSNRETYIGRVAGDWKNL